MYTVYTKCWCLHCQVPQWQGQNTNIAKPGQAVGVVGSGQVSVGGSGQVGVGVSGQVGVGVSGQVGVGGSGHPIVE